jgi:hypothetical protein
MLYQLKELIKHKKIPPPLFSLIIVFQFYDLLIHVLSILENFKKNFFVQSTRNKKKFK